MNGARASVAIRPAAPGDVPQMCDLLNEIILMGGTTAFETTFTVTGFVDYFFKSQIQISCLVAERQAGDILGFQVLAFHERLPEDWANIATFARAASQVAGIGTALFSETLVLAEKYELAAINATIRADNTGGLAFYDKLGFVTWKVDKDVPLKNRRLVDRVSKAYTMRESGRVSFGI